MTSEPPFTENDPRVLAVALRMEWKPARANQVLNTLRKLGWQAPAEAAELESARTDDLRQRCVEAGIAARVDPDSLTPHLRAEATAIVTDVVDAVVPLVEEATAERLRAELTAKFGLCCEPCQDNRHADCTGYCQSSCCAAWDDAAADTTERIAAWLEAEARRITDGSDFAFLGAHNLRIPRLLLEYAGHVLSGAWKEQS